MIKILLVTFLLGVNLNLFANDDLTISQLINLTARQRALTQRIIKCWLLKNENILYETSSKELKVSINTFDQTLLLLIGNAPTLMCKSQFKQIENQWNSFKKTIEDTANKNYITTISFSNNLLLGLDDITIELLNYNKALNIKNEVSYNYNAVINCTEICAKQRLLTQRLVIYYVLHYKNKGGNLPVNSAAIGILEELNDNFTRLINTEINTPDIADELSIITLEFTKTYEQLKANNYNAIEFKKISVELLTENMVKLYNKFDKVVLMYFNILKN